MTKPKFSVCMCVYFKDNPEWFDTAVQSVLNQTVPPAEVVLVVDGPVGEELDSVIRKYEKRDDFRAIWLEENQGAGIARNIGLQACNYELIAVMDSDDICLKDRFERQLTKFQQDDSIDLVGGLITEFIDLPDNVIALRDVPTTDQEIKQYMKRRNPINQVTVMFKKNVAINAGGYLDCPYHEDYFLWLRMALIGARMANLNDVLVNVRVGADMYRRRGGWKCFKNGAKLQMYMIKIGFIGFGRCSLNILERFLGQVLLPNCVRSWGYKKFMRKNIY